jgi:hypothetical protein
VSLFDADARPVRRGKLGHPNEFGYVVQLTEVTANTRRGARGLILPPKLRAGSTHDNQLLPQTVGELVDLNLALREAAFDAGFGSNATAIAMAEVGADVFIPGNDTKPRSVRTRRRLARYRVGAEGRISHLKRRYAADAHVSRASRERRSGPAGRSSPTTWTQWRGWKPEPDRRRLNRRRRGRDELLLLPAPFPRTVRAAVAGQSSGHPFIRGK